MCLGPVSRARAMEGVDKMHAGSFVSRRRFLGNLASGAALGAAAGPAFGAEKKRWAMRMSTSSVHYGSLPIEQACERIANLGFEAIDIWANFGKCKHLDDAAERLGAEGLKQLLSKHKLKVNAFSIYTTGYEPYAELLGKVGGGVAVRGSQGGEPAPEDLTKRMKAFIEGLKPSIELAEEHDSYLAIENHGNALLHTHDSLKAFVDINTSKRLGVALAPFHLQSINAPIPEAIRTVGKQILFFYAWQNQPGIAQLPGHGPTDFTPSIKALAEIGYRRYVNPFMHQELEPDAMSAALKKSRECLMNCYEKAVGK